jgi:hypothetical protein
MDNKISYHTYPSNATCIASFDILIDENLLNKLLINEFGRRAIPIDLFVLDMIDQGKIFILTT